MTEFRDYAAFIDVDLTLLRCESLRIFILDRLKKEGLLKKVAFLWYYLLRKANIMSIPGFKKKCLSGLKGMDRKEIADLGLDFCNEKLLGSVRQGAIKKISELKNDGCCIYLISASPDFYVRPLSDLLGLSGSFATGLSYSIDGRFTGDFNGRECSGTEKLNRLMILKKKGCVDLDKSYFFTDSYSDLPLLESVSFPVAVCPDKKLKNVCKRRGWKVEYW